jgi:nucleoside-diphosphate-sugar epimerase
MTNGSDIKKTLVLGGTGKTGRRVAKRLAARGAPTRFGSRSGPYRVRAVIRGSADTTSETTVGRRVQVNFQHLLPDGSDSLASGVAVSVDEAQLDFGLSEPPLTLMAVGKAPRADRAQRLGA